MSRLPIISASADTETVAWRNGEPVARARLLADAARVAAALRAPGAIVNLCEDRYHFLVTFIAACLSGRSNLLPGNRAEQTVRDLLDEYPSSEAIDDAQVLAALTGPEAAPLPQTLPGDHVAAILFTSGSTGVPRPNAKRWQDLWRSAQVTRERLPFPPGAPGIVATVPAQHMFGLETTVLQPLVSGARIECARPFFPEDVRATLARTPEPRALVTTPLHLKACVQAGLSWPPVAFVLSSTAPLAPELAAQAEQAFAAPVLEIYGSTETGAMASRRPTASPLWQPVSGLVLEPAGDSTLARAPHLAEPVPLSDIVAFEADGRFRLLGRGADMVNIAGKRASLADLNLKLTAVEGVLDGVFIVPEESGEASRLAAVVVAPEVDNRTIQQALLRTLDPVFLPRPLYRVERLPRNDTGKLPRQALLDLIRQLEQAACSTRPNT